MPAKKKSKKPARPGEVNDCIFCQIVAGKLPTSVRFEDDDILAMDDINPIAPIHVVVIAKQHIESLAKTTKKDEKLLGKVLYRCKLLARELGIEESGYRVVTNAGKWSGQLIPHLHFHLLGGAPLSNGFGVYAEEEVIIRGLEVSS